MRSFKVSTAEEPCLRLSLFKFRSDYFLEMNNWKNK